jgi:hypothetical protein
MPKKADIRILKRKSGKKILGSFFLEFRKAKVS